MNSKIIHKLDCRTSSLASAGSIEVSSEGDCVLFHATDSLGRAVDFRLSPEPVRALIDILEIALEFTEEED